MWTFSRCCSHFLSNRAEVRPHATLDSAHLASRLPTEYSHIEIIGGYKLAHEMSVDL